MLKYHNRLLLLKGNLRLSILTNKFEVARQYLVKGQSLQKNSDQTFG